MATQRTPQLNEFPEELLLQICQHLSSPQDLSHLCCANRHFNELATPVLYSHYSNDHGLQTPNRFKKLYRYIHCLLQRPDLASRLKSLRWDYSALAHCRHRNWEWLEYEANALVDNLQSYGHSFAEDSALVLHDAIKSPKTIASGELGDASLVAVLMLAPNIRDVEIIDRYYGDNIRDSRYWLDPVRLQLPGVFRSLRTANVTMACMKFDDVVHLLRLPSLRELELSILVEAKMNRPEELIPELQRSSSVDHLTFRSCRLHHGTLIMILNMCKAVRYFQYGSFNLSSISIETPTDLEKLKSALDQHTNTLTGLDIEIDVHVGNGQSCGVGNLGSFADFKKLEHHRVWMNPFKHGLTASEDVSVA